MTGAILRGSEPRSQYQMARTHDRGARNNGAPPSRLKLNLETLLPHTEMSGKICPEKIQASNGISNILMVLVFIKCIGDIIIPFVLKYSDNVTKEFADTLSMLMALPLSQILYHWHPHIVFYIGTIIILFSTYFFQ